MTGKGPVFCTICWRTREKNDEWFLLVENRWTDRLKILTWHDELACSPEFYAACCAAHAQLLVIHWMTTATLDYPFAAQACVDSLTSSAGLVQLSTIKEEPDTSGAETLGELAVHRESIDKILVESPSSLGSVLSALKAAFPERVDRSAIAGPETPQYDAFALTEV